MFYPSLSLLSKLLPCKIIAAFQLSPAHTVKRGSTPPTGLLPKEFSFHGQLSFLHLKETEPWHNSQLCILTVLVICWRIKFDSQTLFLFNIICMAHISWLCGGSVKKHKKKKRMVLPARWRCRQCTTRSLLVSCIVPLQEGLYWLFRPIPQTGLVLLKFFYAFFWTLDQKVLHLFALQSPKVYKGVLSFSQRTDKGMMSSMYTWLHVCVIFILFIFMAVGCK